MKILAVDYGDARTGLAVCDAGELLARPVTVIHSHKMEEVLTQTAAAGPRSELCQAFADRLRELSGLPVVLWDERSTTVSAIGILNTTDTRGKKRKAVVDAVAATLILESYLAYRKNHPED